MISITLRSTILSAQYWGRKDLQAIQVIEGIALRFSLLIALAFSGCALLIPDKMMRIFTTDAELIQIGAGYLRVGRWRWPRRWLPASVRRTGRR